MNKVYLAGRFSEYDSWKDEVKKVQGFDFFDPEVHSNQSSPDTFFPDDLAAVKSSDVLIAHPGPAPCVGTWIEVGYFLANKNKKPGDFCKELIMIWQKDRIDWSLDFVKKAGVVVSSVDEAIEYLEGLV
jgi:nucleoside 2-deoxyribosyltransferase